MVKYVLALAFLLTVGLGMSTAADKKLSRDDFDLGRKVDRVSDEVIELHKKVEAIDRKLDQLIAEKSKQPDVVVPPTQPVVSDSTSSRAFGTGPRGPGVFYDPSRNVYWQFIDNGCPNGRCPNQR